MVGIYIGSTAAAAGKNLACMALGLVLGRDGRSVGYMKPYGQRPRMVDDRTGDIDAMLVQEVLGQNADPEVVTPVVEPANIRAMSLRGGNALERVGAAYTALARGRDVMLVGGTGSLFHTGRARGLDGLALVRRLDLRVVLVERYHPHPEGGGIDHDAILYAADVLGDRLAGVLLNDLPDSYQRDA